MNIYKRFTSFILAICLCFALIPFAGATTQNAADNVSDIELLNMLGIFNGYEDGNLHPDWSITRMQFAALVIRMLGYDDGAGQTQTGFSDVNEDNWGSGYVKMAYDLGIVSGYGDSTFRPENPVTQAEAVKMVVSALGYGIAAEQNGGYPQGYISYASRLDILENAVSQTAEATRGYVATLIANALETRFLEQVVNGDTMEKSEETILTRMGIIVREGTLSAVHGASMSGGENLEKDEVIVSGEKFKTNLNISADFIGSKVKIYIRDYGKNDELIVAIMGVYSTDALTVSAENIEAATTLSALVYEDENGKIRTEALEGGIKITYNGKLIDNSLDYTDNRLKPQNGSVKLIDTNNNGKYDSAVVKDYETFVVRSVTDSAIYGEFGNSIKFEDEDTVLTAIYNGMTISLSDIEAGDVISGAVSLDGSIVEIIICRDTLEGIVTMQEDTGDTVIYSLEGGEELSASREYAAALAGGYNMAEKIELGSDMLFRLNYFGEIASATINSESDKDEKYGFILEMDSAGSAIKNVYEMKILTTNNRFEIFKTAQKGTLYFGREVNGSYVTSRVEPKEIFNYIHAFDTKGNKYITNQVVMYELDASGDIKGFYLADSNEFTDNFSTDRKRYSRLVSNRLVDGKYYWDNNTSVFHIPSNAQYTSNLSSVKADDYFSSGSYTLELYDIEPDGYINCILYTNTTTASDRAAAGTRLKIDYVNSPVMIITDSYVTLNEDGMEYMVIEGWENKSKVRRLVSDTLSKKAKNLRKGAIIQYTTNSDDKLYAKTADNDEVINQYTLMFNLNEWDTEEFMKYDYTGIEFSNPRIKFGLSTVSRFDYPLIRLGFDGTLTEIHSGTMIYVYDRNSGEITKGDYADIAEGEKIFTRQRYSNLREVVVVKE